MKLLIKNGRVVDPSQKLDEVMDLLLEDGKIAKAGKKLNVSADRTYDATGKVVAPGFIDMHVHLREPGVEAKENIETGTMAAAAGGITTVACMPNTKPAIHSSIILSGIKERAREYGYVNVQVIGAITMDEEGKALAEIGDMAKAGAIAFSDDGKYVQSNRLFLNAAKYVQSFGKPIISHSIDQEFNNDGYMHEGAVSAQLGVKGIPAAAEDCGTAREIALAAAENVPVHICYVSTKTSVDLVRDAKRRGVKVTAETAPHYFSLTEQELLRRDADYRMNPPLRTRADVSAILGGLTDGTLDCIATDHAPHTVEEKSDFEASPNGSIGMETSLAVGVTYLVKTGVLSFGELVRKMSVNPANILGINAGTLSVGAPADIALVDLNEEWTVDVNRLHGKSKNTPFKGMTLTGKVKRTLLNGQTVFIDE